MRKGQGSPAADHPIDASVTTGPRVCSAPTFPDVLAAAARLQGSIHRTPVLTSRTADSGTGAVLSFKAELFQRTGSFKIRGATNAISLLTPAQRAAGIVAFSSGNHAQAVACAAAEAGIAARVVMPADAPAGKRAATAAYGATIILYDRATEDREAIARDLGARHNLTLIPPFDDPAIIAGQGTCALELFEQVGPLDLLVVPVGGGGLLAGCALVAHALCPACRVVGVEPEAGDDVRRSLAAGHPVRIDPPRSIADGALTTRVGDINFAIIRRLVADIVTVPDAALLDAMAFFAARMKIVVEPTGCLPAAALFTGALPAAGLRVGVILSGGNVTDRGGRGAA